MERLLGKGVQTKLRVTLTAEDGYEAANLEFTPITELRMLNDIPEQAELALRYTKNPDGTWKASVWVPLGPGSYTTYDKNN